jgi:hypothetical protein
MNSDWLFAGEPLYTWLLDFSHLSIIGDVITLRPVAVTMSWFGMIFDSTIVLFLLNDKTRKIAYVVLCCFHSIIWLLFPIGIFSFLMIIATSIFFPPGWDRKINPKHKDHHEEQPSRIGIITLVSCVTIVLIQTLLPLRHHLYPGDVNWSEEGFRFSWRVMLIEKAAFLEYTIIADGKRYRELPRRDLPPFQFSMMATQPDMILQYANELERRYKVDGSKVVEVYADSVVWINGHHSKRLINPETDLANTERSLSHKSWILLHND